MDIKEVTLIKGCFGEDILIDGKNINDVPKEQILKWMIEKIKTSQHYSFIETFKHLAWQHLYRSDNIYHSSCDQCGDWNSKDILKFYEDEK